MHHQKTEWMRIHSSSRKICLTNFEWIHAPACIGECTSKKGNARKTWIVECIPFIHSVPPQPEPHRKIAIAVNPAPAIPPAFPYYFPRCNQINLQLRPSSFHISKNIFPSPLYVAYNFLMNIQTMIRFTTPPAFRPREPHQKLRPYASGFQAPKQNSIKPASVNLDTYITCLQIEIKGDIFRWMEIGGSWL